MNLEEIVKKQYPIQKGANNPILRTKSTSVEDFDDNLKEYAEILLKAMEIYDGVGLASPQIGVNKNMVAIAQFDKKEKNIIFTEVLINPKIIKKSKQTITMEEGCLSLPGVKGEVERAKYIEVSYQDVYGKSHILKANNLNSVIIQHELDHLDGILFIDKLKKKKVDLSKMLF